jgi:heme O synthase-like polyprenyltransferase
LSHSDAPFDQRAARAHVRPLVGTRLHPNHLTALGPLLGLGAAWAMVRGGALTP